MFREKAWSTQCVGENSRIRFWKSAICDAVFELDVNLQCYGALRASIRQKPIGPMGISLIELNTAQTIQRSKEAISRSSLAQFELVTMKHGQAELVHRNESLIIRSGDSILIDSRQPYKFSTSPFSRNMSFHIPVAWLEHWLPDPELMVGKKIDSASPWGRAIAAMADAVPMHSEAGAGGSFHLFADQIAGALALALARDREQGTLPVAKQYTEITDRLNAVAHDCELTATLLANSVGISVRYLHKIFAANRTSYGAELLELRLSTAARMLENEKFTGLSIAEIADRSGFSDPSHFYRRFRTKFGVAPGAYRLGERRAA